MQIKYWTTIVLLLSACSHPPSEIGLCFRGFDIVIGDRMICEDGCRISTLGCTVEITPLDPKEDFRRELHFRDRDGVEIRRTEFGWPPITTDDVLGTADRPDEVTR
jgi:hypothetical protein